MKRFPPVTLRMEKRETKVLYGIENRAFIFVFFKCQKCLSR